MYALSSPYKKSAVYPKPKRALASLRSRRSAAASERRSAKAKATPPIPPPTIATSQDSPLPTTRPLVLRDGNRRIEKSGRRESIPSLAACCSHRRSGSNDIQGKGRHYRQLTGIRENCDTRSYRLICLLPCSPQGEATPQHRPRLHATRAEPRHVKRVHNRTRCALRRCACVRHSNMGAVAPPRASVVRGWLAARSAWPRSPSC